MTFASALAPLAFGVVLAAIGVVFVYCDALGFETGNLRHENTPVYPLSRSCLC